MSIIQNYLLFNHTYLQQLQQDDSHDEAASDAARGVREWYDFRDTSSTEELVSSWVDPMLSILELHLQPLDDRDPRTHLVYSSYDRKQPLAWCYVTPSDADLDTTRKGAHWMAQAVIAARRWQAEKEDGVTLRWVILTNGNLWRLLDAEGLRRYEAFLQVDLGELAQHGADITAIRIFYHCFHRSAFVAGEDGKSGLERLLAASTVATERAEKHLKQRVSHDDGIMAQLSRGFVAATGQNHFSEAERDAIYRDATYLLYRLLFILYAEARGLLPVDNPAYREQSLQETVALARRYQTQGMADPQATTLWQRLQTLFAAIDEGDERLGVPAYNGGLFDNGPEPHDRPHLRESYVADAYLASALHQLAYLNGEPLDYRDLSVRHLGSLYEGMIEYQLFVAEEPVVARRDSKGNIRYLPEREAGGVRRTDQRIEAGDVYFAQSSGERRATGTYYTPEYIVHYIVENTVAEGLAERREKLEEQVVRWQAELAGAAAGERARLQRQVDGELLRFVEEEVLTFRVCDPAMGSGHFLVNASQQMANVIVETLHLTGWDNEELDSDPAAWRRRVAEGCLYGVDINAMAVELAKLSLWLATMAVDKPLGFLDHHLRHGNSLIGARLEDFAALVGGGATRPSRKEEKALEAGQLSLLERMDFQERVGLAADMMAHISRTVSESLADVKAQEAEYEEVREALAPFRRLADLVVARHFGVEAGPKELQAVAKYLTSGSVAPVPQYEALLEAAADQQDEYTFFHWQLEFPEVFFGADGEAEEMDGFDVVVGNPPYRSLKASTVGGECYSYYLSNFETLGYKKNLYLLFVEVAVILVRVGGFQSYILPEGYLTTPSYAQSRELITQTFMPASVLIFDGSVFEDATIGSAIVVLYKGRIEVESFPLFRMTAKGLSIVRKIPYAAGFNDDNFTIARQGAQDAALLADKLREVSVPLGEIASINIGMMIRDREKVVHQEPLPHSELFLYGKSIERYVIKERQYARYSDLTIYGGTKSRQVHQVTPKGLLRRTGDRLIFTVVSERVLTECTLYMVTSDEIPLEYLAALLNSRLLTFFYRQELMVNPEAYPQLVVSVASQIPIRKIRAPILLEDRDKSLLDTNMLSDKWFPDGEHYEDIRLLLEARVSAESETVPLAQKTLVSLVQRMFVLSDLQLTLEKQVKLFQHLPQGLACTEITQALHAVHNPIAAFENIGRVRHDIEALRLSRDNTGHWLLELAVKERDPNTDWKDHRRDADGNFVRRWLPAYRLHLDEKVGRYYHYVFQNLDGFSNAGKFPGGSTRTTEQKLLATKIPEYVDVDLTPLEEAEKELTEVRRKIELTDDLIDQIVYKLYGLTEEEIAIVEGRVQ